MKLLLTDSSNFLLKKGGYLLLSFGFAAPPEVTVTSTGSSTFQSSFTLQGTCNSATDYIKVFLNNSTKFQVVFPVNNTWEYTVPCLSLGFNVIYVIGVNLLTQQTVQVDYYITYAIPLATEVRYAVPFIQTASGWKQIHPRIKVGNRLQQIKAKVGLMSSEVTLSSVLGTGYIGNLTALTSSNGTNLIGLYGIGNIGSLTPSISSTVNLGSVYGTGSVGSMTAEEIFARTLSGLYGTGSIGVVTPEVHSVIEHLLSTELQIDIPAGASGDITLYSAVYTVPYPISSVYLEYSVVGYSFNWRIENENGLALSWDNVVLGWVDITPNTKIRLRASVSLQPTPGIIKISKLTY